jgi:hypothetical protein
VYARIAPIVIALVACSDSEPVGPTGIAPADGQTAWVRDAPIVVMGEVARYPEGQPVPDLIRVIDLDRGEAVAGTTEWFGDALVFAPDEPWSEDADYLWTLRDALDEARQPEFEIDPFLQGEAFFSTGFRLEVLNAGWAANGELCVLTSRPAEAFELEGFSVTIDAEAIPLLNPRLLEGEALGEDAFIDVEDDLGLGAICAQPERRSGAPQVRVFLGNRSWLRDMFFVEPTDLAAAARRGTP